MPKYKVTIPYACHVAVYVEADDREDAIELAILKIDDSDLGTRGEDYKTISVNGDATLMVENVPIADQETFTPEAYVAD